MGYTEEIIDVANNRKSCIQHINWKQANSFKPHYITSEKN